VARCKLWVQSNDWLASLRADRIVALRVRTTRVDGGPGTRFHLDAVTADAVADDGLVGVELCSGTFDEFADLVPNELMRLIALHTDSRHGGVIECCNEEEMLESDSHRMPCFSPFPGPDSGRPGSEAPARPPRH
jgi:hypothetical protein